ncbi:GxGYxYP domain-containing protein [Clostridium sp. WILCCON 0269]|uniref:GxGYxYP domain-containing protein n=1 Tax=Candidatus Clostridium eludens TaxID=3381663 RepID=A0ABW8SHV2_9CLOT
MKLREKFNKIFIILIIFTLCNSVFISEASAFSAHSYYTKNPKRPNHLYAIYENDLTSAEKTMIATLQGVISNISDSQIYILSKSQQDYKIWLDDLKENYGITYDIVKNPWYLLDKFKSHVKGYVLYHNSSSKDPSINNACSLAAVKNCLAIDESIENKIRTHGIKKMKGDCRNTDKYWAYNNLWKFKLNHSTVIELSPNKSVPLRDYAIMNKCLVFYEDTAKDFSLRDKIFGSMKKDSICLGWGPDEYGNVKEASKYGVSVVPADWSYNLTVLSAFPSIPITQESNKAPLNNLSSKDMHYVTFVMSDGDNQQWNLGNNYSSKKWYGSSSRGKFNMGFAISPSIYELAPTAFKLYYKSAHSGTYNDNFIVSPSGEGYMYPSKFKEDALKLNIKRLNNYMKKADQKYVAILDDWSFRNIGLWDKYTAYPNIQGIFYLNYSRQDDYKGEILWSNGKPVVSCRNLLWSKLEENNTLIEKINSYVNQGYTDISNPNAYTFVYVHAWSKTMGDVEKVISELNKNPKIKIVTPDTFMNLIKNNIKHK